MATQLATFAGGCFWCTEAVFRQLKGVKSVISGFAGGTIPNPTYELVMHGMSGFAEASQLEFDPAEISYIDLVDVFFYTHDPTTLNRQGADVGSQYRSAIFYHNDQQKQQAEKFRAELDASHYYPNPIVTEITEFTNFYPAEDYTLIPYPAYCRVVIDPKLQKLKQKFQTKLIDANN